MSTNILKQIMESVETSDGAGVNLRRSIGLPGLRNLDPFLMLDHFSSANPDDYVAGFPDHPHRGFITLTYMIDGHMEHRDSMGNRGDLRTGGAQWMKAASGVIHSEMPKQTNGLMRGFQLWINLPAAEKMSDPAYQEFGPEGFPVVSRPSANIRVLSGELDGSIGPIVDEITQVRYLDIELEKDGQIEIPMDASHSAFAYVYEGRAHFADQPVDTHQITVVDTGKAADDGGLRIAAPSGKTRLILVSGKPLGEPIVQQGPFVMNTREEIEQAMADYRDGTLVRNPIQAAS